MRVRWLVVVGLLWVAGCSDGVDNEVRPLADVLEASVDSSSTSSVSSATSSSSTTAAPTTVVSTTAVSDEWAIPDNPDAAYFERVLNELERLFAENGRSFLDQGRFTPEGEAILRSVSAGINLESELEFWSSADPTSETFDLLTLEQAPLISDVVVVASSPDCVIVSVVVSFDGVYNLPRQAESATYLLRSETTASTNQTGWKVYERRVNDPLEDGCGE